MVKFIIPEFYFELLLKEKAKHLITNKIASLPTTLYLFGPAATNGEAAAMSLALCSLGQLLQNRSPISYHVTSVFGLPWCIFDFSLKTNHKIKTS